MKSPHNPHLFQNYTKTTISFKAILSVFLTVPCGTQATANIAFIEHCFNYL
jgi:hypothetical protein